MFSTGNHIVFGTVTIMPTACLGQIEKVNRRKMNHVYIQ